jgi:2-dehydropantoate 2-reductase
MLSGINTPCFVFMVNNPSGYNGRIKIPGPERVLPAFPGSGGKIENGILHYDIISGVIQYTTIGEPDGKCPARLKELRGILKKAGFMVSISKNMDVWQKTHVAMVAPLGDVIYYDGGNDYTVSKNRKVIRIMNLALKKIGTGTLPDSSFRHINFL